jgi:hypothetical protein
VKLLLRAKICGLCLGLCGLAAAQPGTVAPAAAQAAPAEVVTSAVAAVNDLGKQIVMGRYQAGIERMNPLWKDRTAARMGGIAKLEKQLEDISREMVAQGVSIISFEPKGAPRSYEVGPGKKVETINGRPVETLIYTKWLVLVPTSTKFRIFPKSQPKPIFIESISYQVAISDKGKNDWTFIDGSSLTLSDLRKLYINLPSDLELPPIQKKEAN